MSTLLYLADTGIPLGGGEGSASGSKTEMVVKAEASEEAKLFAEAVKGFTMAVERLGNTRAPMGGCCHIADPRPHDAARLNNCLWDFKGTHVTFVGT